MVSGERGMNPVAKTIINSRKEILADLMGSEVVYPKTLLAL